MRRYAHCLLIVAILIPLLALAGCKVRKTAEQKPQPRKEEAKPVPREPSTLEDAIRLYDNSSSARDADAAVKVFYKYAYSNDPEGQYRLGLARWEGKGSEQSDLEAYVWWTIAAQQHHLEAMNRIEDVATRFDQEWLDEITNRANDWKERVRVTPEMH